MSIAKNLPKESHNSQGDKLVDKIGQFATLPLVFIDHSESLSDEGFRLFVILRRLTHSERHTAWPSYTQLQQRTGWKRSKVSKAIRELKEGGWLTVEVKVGIGSEYHLKMATSAQTATGSKKRTSAQTGTATSAQTGTATSAQTGTATSAQTGTATSAQTGTQNRLNGNRSREVDQRKRLSVCVDASPVAPQTETDTHTASGSLKENKVSELTPDQSKAIAILRAYFPSLGANHYQKDLAEFVSQKNINAYKAADFCAWLDKNDREFKFMKMRLLKELWEECISWENGAAQSKAQEKPKFCGQTFDGWVCIEGWLAPPHGKSGAKKCDCLKAIETQRHQQYQRAADDMNAGGKGRFVQ